MGDLEEELQRVKDAHNEERFIWILAILILCNAFVSPSVPIKSWIFLVLLQLVFLIALAQRLGIDEVVVILSNLLAKVTGRRPGD